MKASATHIDRAALRIRAQLITARTSMANQLRGLLKLFGLRMGTARTPGRRAERLSAFYAQRPDLKALFAPLIASMEAIEEQLREYNRLLNDRAKADEVCARLMSVPGVGPIIALTYASTIEDPRRFARSEDVGAYAGLVPRRSQSGERDVSGHISKAGDPMSRKALYEAANVALSQVKRPFALLGVGQEYRRSQRRQEGQNGRSPKACRTPSFALAERDRVPLGLIPAFLIPISHAPDDLVRFVEGQTSFGTQRRPPIPLGRDHEGSDEKLPQLSDDLETTIANGKKECAMQESIRQQTRLSSRIR